jgi:hypothetical protein
MSLAGHVAHMGKREAKIFRAHLLYNIKVDLIGFFHGAVNMSVCVASMFI